MKWLPWGLRLWPILIGELATLAIFMVLAGFRRQAVSPQEAYFPSIWKPSRRYADLTITDRRLFYLAAFTLIIALISIVWIFFVPSPSEYLTEYYILGREELGEDYPRQLVAGEPFEITIGVRNLEGEDHYYHVEALDASGLVVSSLPFVVRDGQGTEFSLAFTPGETGEDVKIRFFLLMDGGSTPYRTLHFYTRVIPRE